MREAGVVDQQVDRRRSGSASRAATRSRPSASAGRRAAPRRRRRPARCRVGGGLQPVPVAGDEHEVVAVARPAGWRRRRRCPTVAPVIRAVGTGATLLSPPPAPFGAGGVSAAASGALALLQRGGHLGEVGQQVLQPLRRRRRAARWPAPRSPRPRAARRRSPTASLASTSRGVSSGRTALGVRRRTRSARRPAPAGRGRRRRAPAAERQPQLDGGRQLGPAPAPPPAPTLGRAALLVVERVGLPRAVRGGDVAADQVAGHPRPRHAGWSRSATGWAAPDRVQVLPAAHGGPALAVAACHAASACGSSSGHRPRSTITSIAAPRRAPARSRR